MRQHRAGGRPCRCGPLADKATRQMSALPAESGHSPTSSRFANPGAAQTHCLYSSGNAEKKPEEYPGFKTLKLNRSSLRELAKCLSGTRLEGLRGRKRNFLSKHCEFLGLLGQRFELLA